MYEFYFSSAASTGWFTVLVVCCDPFCRSRIC